MASSAQGWEKFRAELLAWAGRRLRQTLPLRFASVAEVAALACRRLAYTAFAVETLRQTLDAPPTEPAARAASIEAIAAPACAAMARSGLVHDCERIAELLHPAATEARRLELRNYFMTEHMPWAERQARAALTRCLGRHRAEGVLAEALDALDSHVFALDAFRALAAKHAPAQGKTFQEFLRQAILWCALDVARGLGKRSARQEQVPVEDTPGAEAADEGQAARRAFAECLEQLGTGGPEGRLKRAVYELRQKAYIHPGDMAYDTRALVEEKRGSAQTLFDDYAADQQALTTLADETLPGARTDRNAAYATLHACQVELEAAGHTPSQLDRLADEAERRTSGDMEKELRKLGSAGAAGRRMELSYMLAVFRYRKSVAALEDAEVKWAAWKQVRLPWVRSEKTIGALVGLSQPTVSRRLAAAEGALRDCLAGKLGAE